MRALYLGGHPPPAMFYLSIQAPHWSFLYLIVHIRMALVVCKYPRRFDMFDMI